MGRWFTAGRGRALSLASLGHPMGEALLPPLVAGLLTFVAWRQVWIGMAIAVVAAFVPAVLILGGVVRRRGLDRAATSEGSVDSNTAPSWTRKQVLADKRFYALLPGVLAPPFIVTGVLFHQVHLVTVKSWTLAGFAACYPLFAASQTGVALGLGWLVDRHGAARLMPFYLLPLSAALAVAAIGEAEVTAAVFMTLMGCTAGGAAIVFGALWPELYGVAHLGAIRSLAVSSMVFATALAPGAMGWLIDEGVRLETQLLVLAVYTAVCAAFFGVLRSRLTPRAPPVS
jgi:MFS family permease